MQLEVCRAECFWARERDLDHGRDRVARRARFDVQRLNTTRKGRTGRAGC